MRGRLLPGPIGVLLRQLLPVEARETVIAELAEEYLVRKSRSGSGPVARLWLWRETLSLLLAYLRVGVLRGRPRELTVISDARRQRWRSSRHGASAERERRFGAFGQDVRHGVRSLRHRPAFTAAAVATIAIGIGANATIFMIMQGVPILITLIYNFHILFRFKHDLLPYSF